jgi:hypothetical protein
MGGFLHGGGILATCPDPVAAPGFRETIEEIEGNGKKMQARKQKSF